MHDHAPRGIRAGGPRRLLALSLAITATVLVVQVIGAVLTGSLALLADAGHMFTDSSALVVALVAATVAARPADDRQTYGYQRAEVFGALINAIILVVLCAVIAVEAVRRLLDPVDTEVQGLPMMVVALIGLVANGVSLWLLSIAQRTSINARGAYLEVLGDLLGSVVVLVAAVVVWQTGWMPADAVASLAIAVLIVPRAVGLLREVVAVLGERAPSGTRVPDIREHLRDAKGVVDVHDVHVWQLTRGAPVFTAHIVVAQEVFDEGRAGTLLAELQSCLAEHFDVAHSTFQLEPAGNIEHDHHA